MKRCLVATAALAALASLALPAAPVFAHAGLESSTPGSSSVLEESPEAIVLDFDEAVEAPLTTIGLFDADARPIQHRQVAGGELALQGQRKRGDRDLANIGGLFLGGQYPRGQ
jgi:methionine-rich copper-binding protein CopC